MSNPSANAALAVGQEKYQALMERAAVDRAFRDSLTTDPRVTLEAFLGQELPAGVSVAFVENEADTTIVLPDYVDETAEISESDLEAVAGGVVSTPMCVFASIMGTMALTRGVKTLGDDDAWFD